MLNKEVSNTAENLYSSIITKLEICELVGIYTLSKLKNITSKDDVGLYCDNGLILLIKLNGQQTDKIRKNIIKVFTTTAFQIKTETSTIHTKSIFLT